MSDNNNTPLTGTFEKEDVNTSLDNDVKNKEKSSNRYILTIERQEVSNGLTIINEIDNTGSNSGYNTSLMYVGIQTGTGGKIINKLSRK